MQFESIIVHVASVIFITDRLVFFEFQQTSIFWRYKVEKEMNKYDESTESYALSEACRAVLAVDDKGESNRCKHHSTHD